MKKYYNIIMIILLINIPLVSGVTLCDGLISCAGCDNYVEEYKCYMTDPDADKIVWIKEQECDTLSTGNKVEPKDSKIPLCTVVDCIGDCNNYIVEFNCYLKDPNTIMIKETDCAVKTVDVK